MFGVVCAVSIFKNKNSDCCVRENMARWTVLAEAAHQMKTLVSDRELNNNRKSHLVENDKLDMCPAKRNLFRTPSSIFANH